MTATIEARDVGTLPLAPKNPLPFRQLFATRQLHTGLVTLSQAGGPISRIAVVPKRVAPPIVLVTSPAGIRDVLGRTDNLAERSTIHEEVRNVVGDNLFVLPNSAWPPRPAAGVHQAARRPVRRAHVAGRAVDRRPLA